MNKRSVLRDKRIVKKKTFSVVSFGLIFLISTLAYYFVNNSNAQNVYKLKTFILDEEAQLEETCFETKVAETNVPDATTEENSKKYSIKILQHQNGYNVLSYKLVSKEDYQKLLDLTDDEKKIKREEETKIEEQPTETVAPVEEKKPEATITTTVTPVGDKKQEITPTVAVTPTEEKKQEATPTVTSELANVIEEKITETAEPAEEKKPEETVAPIEEKKPEDAIQPAQNVIPVEENQNETKPLETENQTELKKEELVPEKMVMPAENKIEDEKPAETTAPVENKKEDIKPIETTISVEEKKEEAEPAEVVLSEKEKRELIKKTVSEINGIIIKPNEEFEISKEIIDREEIFIFAQYDCKEIDEETRLYNMHFSEKKNDNTITLSGYMPKDAKIKVTEVDAVEAESRINADGKKEVKLKVAYDIKIIANDKEYEPYEFDENIRVEIKGEQNKKVNIWHIKENNEVEKVELEQEVNATDKEQIINNTITGETTNDIVVEQITNNTITDEIENNTIKEQSENSIIFNTNSFSIYGIEEIDEVEEEEVGEIEKVGEDEEQPEKDPEKNDDGIKAGIKGGPLRAPAPNLPDTTLEIDDYTSDYYYYLGKNYTDNPGTVGTTYSDSSLARVTINYYGFAQGETDPEKKGRISLTETQDIVQNIRCVPKGNNVVIELMENPFMDKPTGYGFGGWTASTGAVTQDSNTLTYKLTLNVSGETTVNLYANWIAAKVVYVNQIDGNDNLNDGLSEEHPFGSWQKACQTLYNTSTNRSDRERNIIVVTR